MNKLSNLHTFYRDAYLPPKFSFTSVNLDFSLNPLKTIVASTIAVQRLCAGALVLKGEDLELLHVKVNGQIWRNFELCTKELKLHDLPDTFQLEILCSLSPMQNTSLMGLYISEGNFFTQCEAEGFRKITYFLDQPDVLTRFTVRLNALKEDYPILLSNGNLIEQKDLPNGMHSALWEDPFPKPSYLFAIVAGNLQCIEQTLKSSSGKPKLLQVWVKKEDLAKTHYAMESLIKAIRWDESRFGLELDLDRFMIVAVSDFNMGAMENKGLNIFNTKYVLADAQTATDTDFANIESVVGHEYFHNWTGNRVTCRDWFQLSLKEGLTVFRDQEFSADLMGSASGRAVKRIEDVRLLRQVQFPEDAGPMAHPIRPDSYQEINNFYTVTIYEKGAEIIRMQHTLLGESGFQKGLQLYFARHDGQAVTCDDFVQAMADANQIDLDQFKHWYSQAGTPRVCVAENFDAATQTYTVNLTQSCQATPEQAVKPLFHIPLKTKLLRSHHANEEFLIELKEQSQTLVYRNQLHKPILSINRDFSAPIIIDFKQDLQDLYYLYASEDNPFNQWEAGQKIAVQLILGNSTPEVELLDIWKNILQDPQLDPGFKELILTLPSETYLHEQVSQIHPQEIHRARKSLRRTMAKSLSSVWLHVYENHRISGPYEPSANHAGKRALKNLALHMITENNVTSGSLLAQQQFDASDNMTDRLAALATLVQCHSSKAQECLAKFFHDFQANDLAIDKWFAIQACQAPLQGHALLDHIQALKKHPAFTLRNPNRVRSLIHAFCMNNPAGFHDGSGNGYHFWLENILELDKINPQIAARLSRALDHWRKFSQPHQDQMRVSLEKVQQQPLSNDVAEIIHKALNSS